MLNLLKNLINARSTTDTGELAAARALADFFEAAAADTTVDVWDANRANCTVRVSSTGEKPALMFAAHLDVVPPGDQQWDFEPFQAVEKNGRILGRGATDMKAGIAATAAAIAEILSEGHKLKGDIIFTATAGEETDSCGIKRFVKNHAPALGPLAGIIIPEPTGFDIVTAHRGILWAKITTKGRTAHGSTPHLGRNAITHMTSLLNSLENFKIDHAPHPRLGACSMSINQIHGGNATNVIPDRCTINIDIRTLPGMEHQDIIDDLRKICDQLKQLDVNFDATIEIERSVQAVESDDDSDFIKDFCKVTQIPKTCAVGYTTDASFLTELNTPITIFGPGHASQCHKPNEYVEIADVKKAKQYFKDIITCYLT